MIPKRYSSIDLVGRKCRPVRNLQNNYGQGITPYTICTIVSAHYGIKIQTVPCPCCGQYTEITRVSRDDLELLD